MRIYFGSMASQRKLMITNLEISLMRYAMAISLKLF